jgi:cytochrome P450
VDPVTETSGRDWFTTNRTSSDTHYDELRRKRAEVGIEIVEGLGPDPAFICYRHEDVALVLSDAATYSSDVVADRYAAVLGRRTLIALDRDEHLPLRRRLAAVLSGNAQQTQHLVDSVVSEVMGGMTEGRTIDFAHEVATVIPARVLTRLLGLDDALAGQLADDAKDLARFGERPREGLRAARRLRRLLNHALTTAVSQHSAPRDGTVIAEVADAVRTNDATFDEALDALILLVWAGCETTVPALSTLAYCVIAHAEHFDEVEGEPGLIESAINETLRWEAPVQMTARRATRTVELGGVTITDGSLVLAHIGSANRDQKWCPEPDNYDIRRDPTPKHLAFGKGFHRCVGNVLAKYELRAALERLMAHRDVLQFADGVPPAIVGEVVRCPETLRVSVSA